MAMLVSGRVCKHFLSFYMPTPPCTGEVPVYTFRTLGGTWVTAIDDGPGPEYYMKALEAWLILGGSSHLVSG